MSEHSLQREIQLELGGRPTVRIFRNNIANLFAGDVVNQTPTEITLRNYRRVQTGLCKGSSDLIGFKSRIITPEMVDTKIAQFLAVEVKSATGRATDIQKNFIDMVNNFGGIGIVAKGMEDIKI